MPTLPSLSMLFPSFQVLSGAKRNRDSMQREMPETWSGLGP